MTGKRKGKLSEPYFAQLTSMTGKRKGKVSEPYFILGYPVTEPLKLANGRSQELNLGFFS